jgi:aminopeptidase N
MTAASRTSPAHAFLALFTIACGDAGPDRGPGVPLTLAEHRGRTVSDVQYDLNLEVPLDLGRPIRGTVAVTLELRGPGPIVLDFAGPPDGVGTVTLDGGPVAAEVLDGHIVVPVPTGAGPHKVIVEFQAGDGALNRNAEFLYSLFVPDRARTAFPCFDQPDIKARYTLSLTVPLGWTAVGNAGISSSDTLPSGVRYRFDETAPLSTYLFAFAAGRFRVVTSSRGGRSLRLYHRETDAARIEGNLDPIFDLHAQALSWLEAYTGIPYPFDKFDFVAVPSFQYGGMEHPGAVLYRASSLFLDEAPTQNQLLRRASLIAHETAHMWFGDLVTMRWFDDVWMKEVFANFMAAKIVHPAFPHIDHDLRFFLAHHPAAYAIDRTAGANPIRQGLDNLAEAGTLYGAIIYQKAPIVMRQLERLIGEDALRDGLQTYLTQFAFGNADWTHLIGILDARTEADLADWSEVWVETAGRPGISVTLDSASGHIRHLEVRQTDPAGGTRIWPQPVTIALGYEDSLVRIPGRIAGRRLEVAAARNLPVPQYVLPGADGLGYARFQLDPKTREILIGRLPKIPTALARAVAWMALWEEVLDGSVDPAVFVRSALIALPQEPDELNGQFILGFLDDAFWRYLSADARSTLAPTVESLLWAELARAETPSRKAAHFDALVSMASSAATTERLEALWRGTERIEGLPLSEERLTTLAEALALQDVAEAPAILAAQLERIENPDRRARFAFVAPALSAEPAVRDSVFASFRIASSREHEPWVLSAVRYLNHPLRSEHAVQYVRPALDLLQEIQRTGDIFFPLRWLHATLDGHASGAAADTIVRFLEEHPGYPSRLRAKVLQAADGLFRAAAVREGWSAVGDLP